MMAKKSKETKPKPVRQERSVIPEYKKPIYSLLKAVKVGDLVNLEKRGKSNGIVHLSGIVSGVGTNYFTLVGRENSIPWWTIHDWEIYDAEE